MNDNNVINADSVDIDGGDVSQDLAAPAPNNGDISQDLAEPAPNNSDVQPDVAGPADMSDVDFEEYINNIESGLTTDDGDDVETTINSDDESSNDSESESIPNDTDQVVPDQPEKPYWEFASKDEYQADFNQKFNARHRDWEDLKEIEKKYNRITDELKEFYSVDDRDEAGESFHRQMQKRKAEDQGITVEEYQANEEKERKVKAYDEHMQKQADVLNLRQRMFAAETDIKQSDPEFDLQSVYDTDEQFRNELNDNGGNVYQAYTRYLQRSMKKPQPVQQQQQPAKKQNRAFKENALSTPASGRVNSSAADLSDADFDEYIKKILNT